jgi:predicted dehydrogenase
LNTHSNRIPAVVVGTGFGCRIHVPALRAAGFEVVGLVGTNAERLARKAAQSSVAATFTDLDEAIRHTGAQVVTIATTPATHAELALKAIAHGCHVLCEKPFAFDAAQGAALLNAAQSAGVIHMVAHEFRWLPERALFGRAIAAGMIGQPRFLVIDQFIPFCADPATRLPGWWFDKAAGGGWLGAGGSHLLDQIRAWLGDFESVSAGVLVVSDRGDVADDTYSLRFRLKNGVEGSMQQSAGAWGPMTAMWRCAGTRGTVWIDSGKILLADKDGTREVPMPAELALPPAPPAAEAGSSQRLSHFEIGPFTRLCEALHDSICGQPVRAAVAVPTFRDGLATMQVMDAIRASAAQGGALQQLEPTNHDTPSRS